MKTLLIIILNVSISIINIYPQNNIYSDIEYSIIEFNNNQIDSIIKKIINFEDIYCKKYPEKCYFISIKNADSLYLNYTLDVQSSYLNDILKYKIGVGLCFINDYPVFVSKSVSVFFNNTQLFKKFKYKIDEPNTFTISFDGPQTHWKLKYCVNQFQFESFYGPCFFNDKLIENPFKLQNDSEIFKIDIIDEE